MFVEKGDKVSREYNEIPCCEEKNINDEVVEYVRADMPGIEKLYDLAELYKVFGDCTRIRILYALFESEMCVCDIAELLNMTTSAISHQLRTLNRARLVKYRREGKSVFYSLADDHVRTIIYQGMEHIEE
ncbi:MAG: helix-turn-helix transcriptional regulator [Ruminococcaceae bacterium]|nr:helix-turn-helix transcriptional regulator [Oscillospiraceae bacterium]